MSIGHVCVLLGEVSIWALCSFLTRLFVFLVLRYIISLHILEINPLSDVSFMIMFSHMDKDYYFSSKNIFHALVKTEC